MKMIDIFYKYSNSTNKYNGNRYVNILVVNNYISELFDNGYIVSVCDFLEINEKGTRPYMEYSLWKKGGYEKEDLLDRINEIRKKALSKGFNENEVFFDIGVLNYVN